MSQRASVAAEVEDCHFLDVGKRLSKVPPAPGAGATA